MLHVETRGFRELQAALAEIPAKFQRPVLLRALRKGSSPIVQEAQRRAPRGDDPRRRGSRDMRRSGESLAIGPAAESISARALRQISPKSAAIRMGPDGKHFYVRFSERGTTRQRRRPFLEPALAGYGGLSFALVEEQLASEIRALGWRLARRAAEGTLSRGDREALA